LNPYKLVTFNATADGNARNAYAQGSTESAPVPLNPTDVLRAGTVPVQRVASSGNAITALLNDTGTNETINFVFSASLPSSAQQTTATNAGWGGLRVVQIADDSVKIAAASTTNAPASLSIANLLNIYNGTYTTWGQVPGYSGSAPSATIIPLLPPSSSSVYKTFIADLTTQNGSAVTLAASVQTVEQNDPSALSSPNAIAPFSSGRLSLWNSGYFHNPATAPVFPNTSPPLVPGIQLLTGYSSPITDYVIFRQKDATLGTAWQPGGTKNWANTLFIGTNPFVSGGAGSADLAAAGVTPDYSDLGLAHS
jgi:hypothetical protein